MNDNHALTVSNLLASLPQVLQDDESMAALASSIAAVLEKRKDEIRSVAIYPCIDELPGDLLDILAKDFKVDWWNVGYSLQKKRQLLKNCWKTHRILGTKEAVMTVLSDIYTDFKVQEWWEYGGSPGCFRVETSNFQEAFENLDAFFVTLNKVKRLSAHLDNVNINFESSHNPGVGIANQTFMEISYIMEEPSVDDFDTLLTDEFGALLVDESGNMLIDREVCLI